MESSVIYSMGTALNRAREHQLPVVVLVGNDWLRGTVRHLDSHGLVLAIAAHENCVIRLEAVNAVRLDAGTQHRNYAGRRERLDVEIDVIASDSCSLSWSVKAFSGVKISQ